MSLPADCCRATAWQGEQAAKAETDPLLQFASYHALRPVAASLGI